MSLNIMRGSVWYAAGSPFQLWGSTPLTRFAPFSKICSLKNELIVKTL